MSNTLESRSPDGAVAIRLQYEGEVRFGPLYFSCTPINFSAELSELLIGQDIHWKSDSSSCVMMVFHSIKSGNTPNTELVRLDVGTGEITSIERNKEGLISMAGFDESGKYSYEVRLPGQKLAKSVDW